MGVAVLYPQDCLKDAAFSPQVLIYPPPYKANRVNRTQPNHRKKRSPPRPNNASSPQTRPASTLSPTSSLAIGYQVRILKRGEGPDLDLTQRLSPGPNFAPSQIGLTGSNRVAPFYAGSSVLIPSPPPSSLPLPVFFTKKSNLDATSDLRRILRLD